MTRSELVRRDDWTLVVVDVQERLAAAMARRAEVTTACTRLARVAALLEAPILVTRQYPEGLGDTVADLAAVLAETTEATSVTTVDKVDFCACSEPAFADALERAGRPQVVIVGMETHICVAQTALTLAGQGRDVYVVADACCSRRDADHEVALDRLRAAGVTVTTSESVMYEAVSRAGTSEFRRVLSIVKTD